MFIKIDKNKFNNFMNDKNRIKFIISGKVFI